MASPMFARKAPRGRMQSLPKYSLHPWVAQVLDGSEMFIANPDRPTCMSFDGGKLAPLSGCKPPKFDKHDIIWVSFTIMYVVGPDLWGPVFRPIDVIRVGRIPGGLSSRIDSSAVPDIDRGALEPGLIVLPPPGESLVDVA